MRLKEITRKNYQFLTKPKVVKLSWIGAVVTWIGSTIIALLIAQLDPAGPAPDPAGYNPLINYISDLGNQDLTPMPIIMNWAMMNTALLMISPALYMKNLLVGDGSKIIRKILAYLTTICILIGMVGLFLTGVFSEDVGEVWDLLFPIGYPWHDLTADYAFTFFMGSGVLVASQFIIFSDILKDKLKLENSSKIRNVKILYIINSWIITPICYVFFYNVPYLWYTDEFWTFLPAWQWAPIWEWLLMISLTIWLTSTCILVVKHLNQELRK
jgi:hypothetical protein